MGGLCGGCVKKGGSDGMLQLVAFSSMKKYILCGISFLDSVGLLVNVIKAMLVCNYLTFFPKNLII